MDFLNTGSSSRFSELIDYFAQNIEHMETKIRELENDLHDGKVNPLIVFIF